MRSPALHALTAIVAIHCGCSSLPAPKVAYDAQLFAIEPVVVQRGELVYLRYRLRMDRRPLRMPVVVKKEEAKAVAYFTGPISFPEYGATIEIPLAAYQIEEFAKSGRFFWRDPDGSERLLKLVREV